MSHRAQLAPVGSKASPAAPVGQGQCNTCQHAHVKDLEHPCRGCDCGDAWVLAAKAPWPAFPRAVAAWTACRDAASAVAAPAVPIQTVNTTGETP